MEKLPLAEYLAKPEYGLSHLPGVILVSYFGSMAIGTNHEDSDVDLRGIYMGSPENLLCQVDEKSWDHHDPDITMYTLHYAMSLLARCNPSMLELLYTRPEDRICYGQLGDMLVRNRHLFLSAQAVGAYMGYCTSQLHKLENALPMIRRMRLVVRSICANCWSGCDRNLLADTVALPMGSCVCMWIPAPRLNTKGRSLSICL